jgi:hypothetical protein
MKDLVETFNQQFVAFVCGDAQADRSHCIKSFAPSCEGCLNHRRTNRERDAWRDTKGGKEFCKIIPVCFLGWFKQDENRLHFDSTKFFLRSL